MWTAAVRFAVIDGSGAYRSRDLDRDELEFDDDLETPKYAPPPLPKPRIKIDD